jgi:hypothetical protein
MPQRAQPKLAVSLAGTVADRIENHRFTISQPAREPKPCADSSYSDRGWTDEWEIVELGLFDRRSHTPIPPNGYKLVWQLALPRVLIHRWRGDAAMRLAGRLRSDLETLQVLLAVKRGWLQNPHATERANWRKIMA